VNLLFDLAIFVTIATFAYAAVSLVRARWEAGENPA